MTTTIYVGDCRDILRTLPSGSVHTTITSPPYWSLRDYSTEPQVWGGDTDCQHVWGKTTVNRRNSGGEREYGSYDEGVGRASAPVLPSSTFCQLCSAWCGSLGLEPTPELYVEHLVEIFREIRRVLRDDGTLWLNLGDSYASSPQSDNFADPKAPRRKPDGRCRTPSIKPKNLVGIPWRVAFALQADGWWLRSDIIWHKPNCMPESVTDRPTKAHEYVFLLTKSARYFYDADAIRERTGNEMNPDEYAELCASVSKSRGNLREGKNAADLNKRGGISHPNGRNRRTVWTVPTHSFSGAHFATFPPALIEPMVKAGTSERGCCAACGAPWERIHESTGHVNKREPAHAPLSEPTKTDSTGWAPTTRATDEWRPTCDCYGDDRSDPIPLSGMDELTFPCTILDPFAGAGTVGLVADRLQRDAILIELNPEYAEMARRRIANESPMFTSVAVERV